MEKAEYGGIHSQFSTFLPLRGNIFVQGTILVLLCLVRGIRIQTKTFLSLRLSVISPTCQLAVMSIRWQLNRQHLWSTRTHHYWYRRQLRSARRIGEATKGKGRRVDQRCRRKDRELNPQYLPFFDRLRLPHSFSLIRLYIHYGARYVLFKRLQTKSGKKTRLIIQLFPIIRKNVVV